MQQSARSKGCRAADVRSLPPVQSERDDQGLDELFIREPEAVLGKQVGGPKREFALAVAFPGNFARQADGEERIWVSIARACRLRASARTVGTPA